MTFRLKLFLFLSFSLSFFAAADLSTDRAALLVLRRAIGGRLRLWNTSAATPCSWDGVFCDNNRVTELRFPGMGLSGELPIALGNLTSLHTISLRFNSLSGPLPPDIGSLSKLRYLYLQGNFFSGNIPSFLFSLNNLIRLNLAGNNFSGEIPKEFDKLTRLGTLYLERNKLTGSIPDLNLPSLIQLNVSFNTLKGEIPSRFSSMPASAFEGNLLCGKPLGSCNGKKLSGGAIAGIVIGSIVGLLMILVVLFFFSRRSKKMESKDSMQIKEPEVEISSQNPAGDGSRSHMTNEPVPAVATKTSKSLAIRSAANKNLVFFGNADRGYDLEDLLRASAEVLGKGTFGTTYKATLDMGIVVAVKRLRDVTVAEKEFREKIEAAGAMNHESLVPLRAYYFSQDEKLLVYDYMPMGSLSALLHGNRGAGRTPLNFETRLNIALSTAKGIAYLHSQSSETSHGNIKSSNILLTTSYEARVADFGLAHLASPNTIPSRVSGYRAPEVTDTRKVSQKADVYSFGVFLLELLTGKPPTNTTLNEEGVDLRRWVQSVVKEEWTAEVFDPELLRYQDVEEDMVQLLQLGVNCTAQYPDNRPSIAEIVSQINEICRSSSQHDEDIS